MDSKLKKYYVTTLQADMSMERNIKYTVCLNMIVRNESNVIRRCLESIKSIIDYWVIVDTGSTDGTQEIICDFMKDVPGELHERPWKDFGHNRSEALALARDKADYCFMIDADEIVLLEENFSWRHLGPDSFLICIDNNGLSYQRCQLVNNRLKWDYVGVLHEYAHCEQAGKPTTYPGIKIVVYPDGARSSDPDKFRKDALVLEQGLLNEPDNSRYVFYLAQSYKDADNIDQAIKNYERRIEMGGWNQEVWYSMYQVAQLKEKKGEDWQAVMKAYLRAYQFYPVRVGPLFRIMHHYMDITHEYHLAYIFAQQAIRIKLPDDILFVEKTLYDWIVPMEFSICAFYVGDHETAIKWNNYLLNSKNTPPDLVPRIISNRKFSLDAVYPRRDPPLNKERRINVVTLFHNPGDFLDNCIERLVSQNYQNVCMLFIDNGSTDGSGRKVPTEDKRISLMRVETELSEIQLFQELLYDKFQDDELVVILHGQDWLNSDNVLTEMNQVFNEHNCQVLYSQFIHTDGRCGNIMPFYSVEAMWDSIQEMKIPLLCVKGSLIGKWFDESSPKYQSTIAPFEIAQTLMNYAGYNDIQFDDRLWVVHNNAVSVVQNDELPVLEVK